MLGFIAHVKDRPEARNRVRAASRPQRRTHVGVIAVLAAVVALTAPSVASAQSSLTYDGTTLTVGADEDGATIEYSAFRFFCFFPGCVPPENYGISSPQTFEPPVPGDCTDDGTGGSYDCDPIPATNVINGSGNADTVDARCFLAASRLVLTAGGGDDSATTSCSNSELDLGSGNDSANLTFSGTASGGPGNDTITGGSGVNTLNGDADKDALRGGAGDDILDGGDGADTLDGEAGKDTLRGAGRRDVLIGGTEADRLEGGDDFDTVSYEDKNGSQPVSISLNGVEGDDGEPGEGDTIAGDVENVIGSVGPDTITGSSGPNDIVALDNGDVINPGGGPDVVDAGPGNDRVEARDGAQDRIDCGSGDDLAIIDEFDTVSNCETVQASRDLMPDVDADGVPAPADCDDRDARRRPGFIDKPGNELDEDCLNGDAPFARIFSPVQSTFTVRGRRTRVKRLRVLAVPEGARIQLRCRGGKRRGCFRKVRRFRAPRGAEVRNIRKPVRTRRLKPRARLEVRILDADSIGKVVRFTMRRSKLPRSRTLCLVPGENRPQRRC
ncbi:MAG: calcium-binding protein [Solirubrobacteraceae bacterium]